MKLNIVIVKNIVVAQRVMIVLAQSVRLKLLRQYFGGIIPLSRVRQRRLAFACVKAIICNQC
jgi:hypothetical protein